MLEHNNPAIDYESLSQRICDESEAPSDGEGFGALKRGVECVMLLESCRKELRLAREAHRVVSPLPSFFNFIFRDQGGVNRALFRALGDLFVLIEEQGRENKSLIEKLKSFEKINK